MIQGIISWSLNNRFMVIMTAVFLLFAGVWAGRNMPVDALPDLSDVQVVIKTEYTGQAPQIIEDQITYPVSTAMMSVPGATDVRGISMFGTSYVYVLFKDGTDIYWARSRVLEYLNQVQDNLPAGVKAALGPDASGVGWVYSYALIDRTGQHDLSELRSLQDWFLRYQLQAVPGVSEVASVGGMVKQYQITVNPNKLRAYNITIEKIKQALRKGNSEAGASVMEMAEAEYMVRLSGYLKTIDDIRNIPLRVSSQGTPLTLGEVADIATGPQMRRGIAELNGEGEVAGAIIVMRYGENARQVIDRVKTRLTELKQGLPAGVEIVPTYDRSTLVDSAVNTLTTTLLIQLIIVIAICALFLMHFRSSMVIIISLPLGILGAYIIMYLQGLNANIMSLGGIAVAIGSMVDGAIVMTENYHKHLQKNAACHTDRWQLVRQSSLEVGPALFFSLIIEAISFMPIFSLQAQEGRLFSPMAFTKSYAMAVAAGLTITLVPVLIGYFVRGNIPSENKNPVNLAMTAIYRPAINAVLSWPKLTISAALLIIVSVTVPATKLGTEFMPALDEGDLMYMPTTYAGISIGKARELLQQTNKLIKKVPEVKTVFGKAGRAETATDPAPLTMIETVVQLRPKSQWRDGMTSKKLIAELEQQVKLPGVSNAWVMPVKTRIDMLTTGIKTPVGILVSGDSYTKIETIGRKIERLLKQINGTSSVYAEQVSGGRYITIHINRLKAARSGLNISDIQSAASSAIGGINITQTTEALARYPVNLRYPQSFRDSVAKLRTLALLTAEGQAIALGDVASIEIEEGPAMIRSEKARITGRILVDIIDRDLGSYVQDARNLLKNKLKLPPGYSIEWTGQYKYMARAKDRLATIIPLTLLIIITVLAITFKSIFEVVTILLMIPFALTGGFCLISLLGYNISVAVVAGFIALAGVTVGNAMIMLVYIRQAVDQCHLKKGHQNSEAWRVALKESVLTGAIQRLRPIMMTVSTILFGLVPVMLTRGTGSEVMQRIAAPMIGGTITSLIATLLVIPTICYLWYGRTENNIARV